MSALPKEKIRGKKVGTSVLVPERQRGYRQDAAVAPEERGGSRKSRVRAGNKVAHVVSKVAVGPA